jgi:hypothetical protein
MPGEYHEPVAAVGFAARLVSLAGINQPSAPAGRVFIEALKPIRPANPRNLIVKEDNRA